MKADNNNKEILIHEIISIAEDYKAGVVASEIIGHGFPKEDIYFRNVSLFRRFFSKDLNNVVWESGENEDDKLVFELNREGFYDMLPEGLTHTKTQIDPGKEKVNEFALHRKQEESARKFFSTFENEFLHCSLQLETIERELYNNENKFKTRDFFECFYGNSKVLTDFQVLTLLYILPLSNKIRADVWLISETLSKILNYNIVVSKQKNKPSELRTDAESARLNSAFLGIDSIISNNCKVHSFAYDLVVHDIHVDNFADFRQNGKHTHVVDFILPFFFPACAEINIILMPDHASKYFRTAQSNEGSFLGFNSYI